MKSLFFTDEFSERSIRQQCKADQRINAFFEPVGIVLLLFERKPLRFLQKYSVRYKSKDATPLELQSGFLNVNGTLRNYVH